VNPNDAVSLARASQSADAVDYSSALSCGPSKTAPWALPNTTQECAPFRSRACCPAALVSTEAALNLRFGEGYQWDRCGALTQQCERFFAQAACFMECDPNAQAFRLNATAWIAPMSVPKPYCDAWWSACVGNNFCGPGFFDCPVYMVTATYEVSGGLIVLSVAFSVSIICGVACVVRREQGKNVRVKVENSYDGE